MPQPNMNGFVPTPLWMITDQNKFYSTPQTPQYNPPHLDSLIQQHQPVQYPTVSSTTPTWQIQEPETEHTLPKDIFKLTRPIFGRIELLLCKDCQAQHFNDKTKFSLTDDGVDIKISLCGQCVLINMEANDKKYWTKGAGKYKLKAGDKRKMDADE